MVERAHPDIVVVRAGGQGEVVGSERFRAWLEPDAFASQLLEPLEFHITADRVLVRVHGRLQGAGSGIEMEERSWALWTFDDDAKVTRIEIFLDHQEAEALGRLRAC